MQIKNATNWCAVPKRAIYPVTLLAFFLITWGLFASGQVFYSENPYQFYYLIAIFLAYFFGFLPALVLFLNAWPYILTPFEHKLEVAKMAIHNISTIALIPHPFIPANVSFAFFPLHGLLYISICFILYSSYFKKQNSYT